jgi:broad specificity phosphatase PhoE
MPRLFAALIRHGDYHQLANTPSAHQPFALTARGIEQAQQAGAAISSLRETHRCALSPNVDSSRLLRAWQTAEKIIESIPQQFPAPAHVESFDELAERGVGSVANLTLEQIEQIVRQDPRYDELPSSWKSDSHYVLPFQGAESLLQAGQRVADHLELRMRELEQEATADTMKMFVGHGAAFRHAAYHLGLLELDQVRKLSMYHAQPVVLEYRPRKGWYHLDGEWKLRRNHDDAVD